MFTHSVHHFDIYHHGEWVIGLPKLEATSYLSLQKKIMEDLNDTTNLFVTAESLLNVIFDILQYVK